MNRDHQITGVVLAGGKSERFGGPDARPKPLAMVNEVPLVLHAANTLIRGGATRVIILTGANHDAIASHFGLSSGHGRMVSDTGQDIKFELRYSGPDTATGGRLSHLKKEELGHDALISYTDVFSNCDLRNLTALRRTNGASLAMLAVNPRQPWGALTLDDDVITGFAEKTTNPNLWINGGIFAADATLLDATQALDEALERQVIDRLITARRAVALRHNGWWRAIDTPKDLRIAQTQDRAQFAFNNGQSPRITPKSDL